MKPVCHRVIIVEGKYDKIRVESCLDAVVMTTEGFGIFKNEKKRHLLRRLAQTRGLVLLCDPDGAGGVIRSFLHTITEKDGVIDLYVPPICGKEKRKTAPSREGLLGVEGMRCDDLVELFDRAGLLDNQSTPLPRYDKSDLYRLGYFGTSQSRQKREAFARINHLPAHLSSNSFLDAVNLLGLDLV